MSFDLYEIRLAYLGGGWKWTIFKNGRPAKKILKDQTHYSNIDRAAVYARCHLPRGWDKVPKPQRAK